MTALPERVEPYPPASLFPRILAFLLDAGLGTVIYLALCTWVLFPLFHPDFMQKAQTFWEEQQQVSEDNGFKEMVERQVAFQMENQKVMTDSQFLMIVVFWVYFALSELVMEGSTLGKKTFKLQTISVKTLKKPDGRTILFRNCLKTIAVTFALPLLIINFTIPFFQRQRRAGHDLFAKTYVTYNDWTDNSAEVDS